MEPASRRNTAPPDRGWLFFGYFGAVMVAGAVAVLPSLPPTPAAVRTAPVAFLLMAALAVLTDARPFATPGPRQSPAVFPSICFSFAVLLVWGVGPAILVQAAAVAMHSWRMGVTVWRTAFNLAQYSLALAAAGLTLRVFGAEPFAPGRPDELDVVVMLFAGAAWFAVSHVLVSTAVWLRFGGRWIDVLARSAGYEALANGALLMLAPLLVAAAMVSAWLIPLIMVPLYAVYRTARLSLEQERLALLDPLTGLANRKALELRVEEEIEAGGGVALLLLDLDRFKEVNDTLGHGVGDRMLVEIGRRLASVVRAEDLVVRLGGDEFAIIAPRLTDAAGASRYARRVARALVEPVLLDTMPLDVAAAIGIAMYPQHGEDVATLMQHADVAMYHAKGRGDAVAVYAPESDPNSAARLSLLGDVRRALESPEPAGIELHYQPQVAIASGEVIGVEALLRWRHPVRGLIDPEELIRIAEPSSVMRQITFRVVNEVTAQLERWARTGLTLRAAINVSVRDLQNTELADHLGAKLAEHGLLPAQLQLEITEGALMADHRRVLTALRVLDRLGVSLSLDDFGTGYSSMLHLRRLPLSEVKIDRSFVHGMATDDDDASIVRSIIELAGALGLRVVAEGVEDEPTWRLLAMQGCQVAQGWFYARPMPADELPAWLNRNRPPRLLRALSPPAAAGA